MPHSHQCIRHARWGRSKAIQRCTGTGAAGVFMRLRWRVPVLLALKRHLGRAQSSWRTSDGDAMVLLRPRRRVSVALVRERHLGRVRSSPCACGHRTARRMAIRIHPVRWGQYIAVHGRMCINASMGLLRSCWRVSGTSASKRSLDRPRPVPRACFHRSTQCVAVHIQHARWGRSKAIYRRTGDCASMVVL